MDNNFDFSGWATRANLRCTDGRTIMPGAFKDSDTKVPLVWQHRHDEPAAVLGHAILEHRDEGTYAYGYFNETESGKNAKMLLKHGDISALSIFANQLVEQGKNVIHGLIREVSLVLAGANPGAFIDSVIVHSDGTVSEDREQGVFYTDMPIEFELEHADESDEKKDDEGKEETVQDILDSMNDKQKVVMYAMLEEAIKQNDENDDSEKEEEETEMKHNVFDKETETKENVICHADQQKILNTAKSSAVGSFKAAMEMYAAEHQDELAHADLGITGIDALFPEYKDVRPGAPELLTTDQGWITKVLAKVHKSPISRIRTRQADARDISQMRAQGYGKGKEKKFRGNLSLLSRTTDPQTVYVKSKLDRDDMVDITDFDVVQYMYNIDRMNINEELARAIVVGDGRVSGAEGKIDETKIRPIWTDDELYTIHADVDIKGMKESLQGTNTAANFGENYIYAEAVIQSLLYAREKYKGSGNPDFICTPHLVNVMLLARDLNGRRIYDNVNELKAALNVREIITAEQFEGLTRTAEGSKTKKLLDIMYNFADYSLGATKGGELTHFTDFDLNFNQQISLLETRVSGANTRVLSAIALEEDVTDGE